MGFLSSIFGFLGGLGGAIWDVVKYIIQMVNVLSRIIVTIAQALVSVVKFLLSSLGGIGRFFKHVWEVGIKGTLDKVVRAIITAHDWLEQKLAPVIKFLKRARAYYDRIYKGYIRPYLQLIQRIRSMLVVLRLLHIKWADALDKRLLQIERNVAHVFLEARGILNQVIDFVNLATNARRISRVVLRVALGRRAAAAIVRAATGLPIGHFLPSPASSAFAWEKSPRSAADLKDRERNPPVSVLLNPFIAAQPEPEGAAPEDVTPEELDTLEQVPVYDSVLNSFLAGDALLEEGDLALLSLREAIRHQRGAIYNAGAGGANIVRRSLEAGTTSG